MEEVIHGASSGLSSGADEEFVQGGCHCGCVRWRAVISMKAPIITCNCSRCAMYAYLHVIVDLERFELQTAWDTLTEYKFNTGTARHLFCKRCGIQSFYVPRSHPEGISLNARCMDGGIPTGRVYKEFDGRHWEANVSSIR